jgi:hypothetical protein
MEAPLGISSYLCLLKETLTLVRVVKTLWLFSQLLAIQRARSVAVFKVFFVYYSGPGKLGSAALLKLPLEHAIQPRSHLVSLGKRVTLERIKPGINSKIVKRFEERFTCMHSRAKCVRGDSFFLVLQKIPLEVFPALIPVQFTGNARNFHREERDLPFAASVSSSAGILTLAFDCCQRIFTGM